MRETSEKGGKSRKRERSERRETGGKSEKRND